MRIRCAGAVVVFIELGHTSSECWLELLVARLFEAFSHSAYNLSKAGNALWRVGLELAENACCEVSAC